MADIARNSIRTRAYVELHYLPPCWCITQNHLGQYLTISHSGTNERFYQAESWRDLVAFALGLDAGRKFAAIEAEATL